MNNYISKYAEFQTHFGRTDPWPETPFSEEEPTRNKVFGTLGFVAFIGLMVML